MAETLKITVITWLADAIEDERIIDYYDSIHRKWLGSHSNWAFCNGRVIEMGRVELIEANK